jgi:serine/threonine-protein kinase
MSIRATGVGLITAKGPNRFSRAGDISVLQSPGEKTVLPPSLFGYDVISKLGQGAASEIYVVSDASAQIYALKHVIRKTDKHDRYIEQLTNEYEIGRLFRHPSLRRIIDLKLKRPILMGKPTEAALVMELIDGQPLDDKPPTSLPAVFKMFRQIGDALAAIHYQRYVHCDVKPHNVLRCADDTIKMIDFGQACPLGTEKPRVQGTPDYIAPEQVKCRPVDFRTDIYNYGATLYWALTGRRAPTYITVEKSRRHIVKKQEYPTPQDLNPGVPEILSDLVMKCLRYYPNDRCQNIREVMNTLDLCEAETANHPQPA